MRIKDRFLLITTRHQTVTGSMAGIGTMTSGTTVASIAVAAVDSGDVVQISPYMYTSVVNSQEFKGLAVESVRSGAFEVRAISSMAPVDDCPFVWSVHRVT